MSDAIKARLPMVLLAEIEHPDGTARFWSGVGPLSWDGYTWTGSGKLGSIAPIRHTSNLEIQEINFGMAGVDPLDIAQLSDNVRNLGGRVWLACLGPGNSVIRDPFQIVDAELDYQSFTADEDGNSAISITARTGFYTLDRALDEAWTSEEQKLTYPTDSGLDLISGLQNQTIQWTQS
jgi:hypothetical protein